MPKFVRYMLVAILIFGLILVRKFEEILFYDPFLAFFKTSFSGKTLPDYDLVKVCFFVFLRYLMNSLLSLAIIACLFWDGQKVKFSAWVLGVAFLILLPIYVWAIESQFSIGENFGFYIRRFLIQPLFLLLLIPAFYYQDYQKKQQA